MSIVYESYTTGQDSAWLISSQYKVGQTFTPSTSHTINKVRGKFFRVGSPGILTVSIYVATAGVPSGGVLVSGTTNGNTLTTNSNGSFRDILLGAGVSLSAGTQYVIVAEALDGTPATHEVYWKIDSTSPTYTGGTTVRKPTFPGDVDIWETVSAHDCMFVEYGPDLVPSKATNPTPTDNATSVDFSGRTLSWDDGGGADTFNVYIGPVGNLSLISSAQAGTSKVVDTGDVPWGQDIYWRIDSTNGAGTTTGDTWSFSTVVVQGVGLGSGGDFIVVAAINGVYLSSDQGDNWSKKTPDGVGATDWVKGICSSDGTYIIVVSDANAIYRSANSGSSWGEINPAGGDTFSVSDLATSDDGQYMVIVGTNSTDATESCYISTDYGATWTAKKPVASSIAWTQCDISNDGSDIAVTRPGYFYISVDSGSTWLEQGMAASATTWGGLSISGDGTKGLIANVANNDEYFVGTKTDLYSVATWAESDITSAGRALLDDANATAQATTLGLGVGDNVTHNTLTLSSIAAEGSDVDKFLVDSTGLIKYRTGTQVLSDIEASPTSHRHDGETLEHDAVNSDGGTYAFNTTGLVTFNQSFLSANYEADNKLTVAATNAGEIDFTTASKKLDIEDNAVVSQDYSSDASPTFAGLTLTGSANIGGDVLPDTDDAYDLGVYYEAPVPGIVDSYSTGYDNQYAFYGSIWSAQTWTTAAAHIITSVDLRLYRIGTPGDITMNIQGTTADKPDGSTIATCTISGNAITTDTDGEWIEFDLGDGAALNTTTLYAIVMSGGVDLSNRVTWKSKLTGTYDGGVAMYTDNGGALWNPSDSDCMFKTYRGNEDDFRRIKDIYLTGDITDGTNATSAAEIAASYAHISNNGSDHSFIDQAVTVAGSPTFAGLTSTNGAQLGDGAGNDVNIDGSGVLSLNGLAGLQLPHMMQSDSTNQTVSSANVAQVVTFNTDVHHFGITRTTSSRFTILKEASYLIAISALCDTTVANKDIEVWLRINGNDVANSNTIVHLGTAAETTLAVTYIKHFDVNDYFEFWMTGENTGCRLLATAAVTTGGEERPACPSIIMTCNYIGVD